MLQLWFIGVYTADITPDLVAYLKRDWNWLNPLLHDACKIAGLAGWGEPEWVLHLCDYIAQCVCRCLFVWSNYLTVNFNILQWLNVSANVYFSEVVWMSVKSYCQTAASVWRRAKANTIQVKCVGSMHGNLHSICYKSDDHVTWQAELHTKQCIYSGKVCFR